MPSALAIVSNTSVSDVLVAHTDPESTVISDASYPVAPDILDAFCGNRVGKIVDEFRTVVCGPR